SLGTDPLLVRRVIDPLDPFFLASDTHGAEENARATGRPRRHLGGELVDGERIAGEVRHQPPAMEGRNATSSPSSTRASSLLCFRLTAASGRSGIAPAPGSCARTRRTTSLTVAGSSTETWTSVRPTSSAYRAKKRTRTVPD